MKKIKNSRGRADEPIQFQDIMGLDGVDMFQNIFLFRNLNFDETVALARLCRVEKFAKGTVIVEENSLGKALYLIKKGAVGVYKGEVHKFLARLGEGNLFGEMSLIEDGLTSATVKAEEDVELIILDRNSFKTLIETNQTMGLKVYKSFCRILSERLRTTSGELLALAGSHKS